MMRANPDTEHVAAKSLDVGDAVGVEKRKWYVAIVKNNTEKVVQQRLEKMLYETYVAKQTVVKVWKNGKKAKVDKVLLPSLVFIRCTESERRELVTTPYINRFMTDKANKKSSLHCAPPAVIPPKQIETLRFMLGQSELPVSLTDTPYKIHDRIIVVRGCLKGLEGEVLQTTEDKSEIIIRVDILGCARIMINTSDIKPAK